MKRHPRRAIWLGRLSEYGVLLVCLSLAVISGLNGSWEAVPPWLLAGALALIYRHWAAQAWAWGWREGQQESLRRLLPHVQLDHSNLEELHSAFTAEGPTWRQRQDYLMQIDPKATVKASTEQLERQWAAMERTATGGRSGGAVDPD